jgi:hypothetical protein
MAVHGKTFIVAFVAMLSAGSLAQLRATPNGLSAEIQAVSNYEGPTPSFGYQHVLAVSAKQDDWTAWGGAMRGSPALEG